MYSILMENAFKCGISRKQCHLLTSVVVRGISNFSMGERTKIFCKDTLVSSNDYTTDYAKSYGYRANHGYIHIDLNKKQLKELFELLECVEQSRGNIDKRVKYQRMITEYLSGKINFEKTHTAKRKNVEFSVFPI